mmetsp:Transcript_38630/g.46763  ORF Transcript_38630/g.46763 Transcript_38630/m.46763 type:complete len:588 (-) Transcript_38630:788-2551(-)
MLAGLSCGALAPQSSSTYSEQLKGSKRACVRTTSFVKAKASRAKTTSLLRTSDCRSYFQPSRRSTSVRVSDERAPFNKQQSVSASTQRQKIVTYASADQNGGVTDSSETDVENVVIIGSGPAGYTAAIYAARANLRPLCFEGFQAGGIAGGQLMTTTEVENFPGFPEGISGPDLMDRMRQQAERWGTALWPEDVEFVDLSVRPFVVRSSDREVRTNALIIATGATAKRLGIPSEHEFWSRGISACAICDGASPLFKGKELAVVGGGDTATEEAIYLTKYASKVHLLVRGPQMRASKAMQDRTLAHPNIEVHFNTGIMDAYPDQKGRFQGLKLVDNVTSEERQLPVGGLFYGIGHTPNSTLFDGQLETDKAGYLVVGEGGATNVPGVYSAGDVHDTEWRQAVTAAGSGCAAAISVERYLQANDLVVEYHLDPSAAEVATTSTAPSGDEPDDATTYDPSKTSHKGQYALRKLYHESDRVLGVLYTSPTCGPCRRLKPMLKGVIEEYQDQVHFVEIDIEADPQIAEAAGVSGTPRVDWFKKKDRIEVMNGVKMKSEYRKLLDANVDHPPPSNGNGSAPSTPSRTAETLNA